MKYLLDTCVISDFVKAEAGTLETLKKHNPAILAVSSITIMEIEYGLAHNRARAQKIEAVIYEMLSVLSVVTFDKAEAEIAGKIRSFLHSIGRPIGSYDLLIAASAISQNLILITSNTAEFKLVPNLKVENWRT